MTEPPLLGPRLERSLARKRRAALAVLTWERAWPALFPACGVAGVILCAALLGLPPLLPPLLHLIVLVVAGAAIVALGWFGLRGLVLPLPPDADRRLELRGGQRHRPLAVLAELPAPGTGDAAIWQAHRRRAAAAVGALRVGWPRSGLAARDRRALRLLLVVALVASAAIAGPDAAQRLRRALLPGLPPAPAPLPTLLQAWLTPPGYTGLAPILLVPGQKDVTAPDVTAPAGSRLTAGVSGGPEGAAAPTVTLGGAAIPVQKLDAGSWQATADLAAGGTLVIGRGAEELGRWELTSVADVPPDVQWAAPPSSTGGRIPQLRLPWRVSHPYGVSALHGEFVLRDRPQAAPLIVDLPLPGSAPRQAHGMQQVDLTPNPWAGLPVIATLVGRDTGGMTGRSDPRTLLLPARHFQHPAARAIVAVRQMLALHPEDHAAAVLALTKLLQDDALWQDDSAGLLNLGAVTALLAHTPALRDPNGAVLDEAQDRLWMLALHFEEGLPARTADALAKARRAMHAALDEARHPQPGEKPADRAARLAQREKELEQALQRHLQALQQQARRDPQHAAPTPSQLQAVEKALQALRQAEQQGQLDEAQQRMAELDQALDEMERERRQAEQTPQQRQRSEQRQRGQQQMSVVRDLVRREGGVLDHAEARATPPDPPRNTLDFPPGQPSDSAPSAESAGQGAAQAQRDQAERGQDGVIQHALRRAVGVLMQAQADLTGSVPAPLDDADRAMREAQAALAGGQDDAAAAAARRAIEALQKGGQAMSQRMSQMFGQQPGDGQPGDGDQQDAEQGDGAGDEFGDGPGSAFGQDNTPPGEGSGASHNDPFGRADREGVAGGLDDGGETAVPETMEQARTRVIQDELRRRAAERTRPQTELDYIGRLLDTP